MDDESIQGKTNEKLDKSVDDLFTLPLAKFTAARNDLAAQLKRDGRKDDADLVKALAKPSVSAWAVNQLHWKHPEAFDRLLKASHHLRKTQSSHRGTIDDMRASLDERREALSELSDLATELLRDAGHNPTPDTIHRVTTNLEAFSSYASLSDGPPPGRLTHDLDPPGFESLTSLTSGTARTQKNDEPGKVTASKSPSHKSAGAATKTAQPASSRADVKDGQQHRAEIAAAKASLQEARRSLTEARSRAQRLETAQKKAHAVSKEADAEAKQAEKQLRAAEERFKKTSASSQDAADRAQQIATEVEEAEQAVEEAERAVEKASNELEELSQESATK